MCDICANWFGDPLRQFEKAEVPSTFSERHRLTICMLERAGAPLRRLKTTTKIPWYLSMKRAIAFQCSNLVPKRSTTCCAGRSRVMFNEPRRLPAIGTRGRWLVLIRPSDSLEPSSRIHTGQLLRKWQTFGSSLHAQSLPRSTSAPPGRGRCRREADLGCVKVPVDAAAKGRSWTSSCSC